MLTQRLSQFYFSPTQTTQKIIECIGDGISPDPIRIISNNLTYPEFENSLIEVEANDLVLIGVPVYSGRIAPTARKRLESIKFAGNPAVLVAVYGNRHFDDALIELRELAISIGLKPFAAATFIGEHSFSTGRDHIAYGRPDKLDQTKAIEFGKMVTKKLENSETLQQLELPEIPGTLPLPEKNHKKPVYADTVAERCVKCGACQTACPTGAVYFKKGYFTNPELCTLCMACVRACPHNARVVDSGFLRKIREKLLASTATRKEPEFFL